MIEYVDYELLEEKQTDFWVNEFDNPKGDAENSDDFGYLKKATSYMSLVADVYFLLVEKF